MTTWSKTLLLATILGGYSVSAMATGATEKTDSARMYCTDDRQIPSKQLSVSETPPCMSFAGINAEEDSTQITFFNPKFSSHPPENNLSIPRGHERSISLLKVYADRAQTFSYTFPAHTDWTESFRPYKHSSIRYEKPYVVPEIVVSDFNLISVEPSPASPYSSRLPFLVFKSLSTGVECHLFLIPYEELHTDRIPQTPGIYTNNQGRRFCPVSR